MVNEIYKMKNEILQEAKRQIDSRGLERMNPGELIDMVHHLAEAEASCMQAKYYDTVITAMEGKSGYQDVDGKAGYASRDAGMQMGYAPGTGGTGSSAGYGSRMAGYHELTDPLRNALRNASPDDRERLRNEVMTVMGAM